MLPFGLVQVIVTMQAGGRQERANRTPAEVAGRAESDRLVRARTMTLRGQYVANLALTSAAEGPASFSSRVSIFTFNSPNVGDWH